MQENLSNLKVSDKLFSFDSVFMYKFGLCFGHRENYKNVRIKILECQWGTIRNYNKI